MLDRLRSAGRRRLRIGLAGLGMVAVVGAVVGVAVSVPRQWNASSLRSVARPTPSSSPIAQVDETGAIPWVDTPAPPYTPVSPIYTPPPKTDARACTARDVSVSQGHGNGETGTLEIGFVFTNTSPTTCVLLGYPEAVAREPGHPDVLAKHATSPGVTPANMPPGTTTDLFLYTYRDCPARYANASGGFPSDLYHEVTFTLPGGRTVTDRSADLDVLCGLGVGQFSVPQPAPTYPKPPLGGATARLELPSAVEAGTSLRYVVDITNPTDTAMVLEPCPSYLQFSPALPAAAMKGSGRLLNCAAAPRIVPGQTLRFAMRLPVPAGTASGLAVVYWTNTDATPDFPQVSAHGSVRIVGTDTPCRSDQLEFAIPDPAQTVTGGPVYGPKGTSSTVTLVATNRSDTACSVRGRPAFTLYDAAGTTISAPYMDAQKQLGAGWQSPPPVTTVTLAPGARTTAALYWDLGCGPTATALRITLPATGDSVTVPLPRGWPPPKCWSTSDPGALAAEPFTAN